MCEIGQNDDGLWELWVDGRLVCDTFRTEAEAWTRWEDVEWHVGGEGLPGHRDPDA